MIKKTNSIKFPVVVIVSPGVSLTKDEVLNQILFEQADLGYSVFFQSNHESKEEFVKSLKSEINKASSFLENKNACLVIVKFKDSFRPEINFLKKEKDSIFSSATADCAKINIPFMQQFVEHIEWDELAHEKVRLVELVFQRDMLSNPDPMFIGKNTVQGGLQTIVYGISGILNTTFL